MKTFLPSFFKILAIATIFYTPLYVVGQCDSIELELTPDFDHICSGDSLFALINGFGQASCNGAAGNYSYCYDDNANDLFTYCPDVQGDGTMLNLTITAGNFENGFDSITIFDGPDSDSPILGSFQGDVSGLSYTASNPSGCISFLISSDFTISCATSGLTALNYSIGCMQPDMLYDIQWEPAELLTDPNSISTGIVNLNESTTFSLTVTSLANPECSSTEEVNVNYISNVQLGENTTAGWCIESGEVNLFDLLNGDPDGVGGWFNSESEPISNLLDPSSAESGVFTHSFPGCEDNAVTLDLRLFETPVLNIIDDFDYRCEGEDLWVEIINEDIQNNCSEAAGSYDYCYGNNENILFSYCPDPGNEAPLSLHFTGGTLQVGFDNIKVYNGPDLGSPLLDGFDNNVAGRSYSANNLSGCISFSISSNSSFSCEDGDGVPLSWEISCEESPSLYSYSWSQPENTLDPNSPSTQAIGLTENTSFEVTVFPTLAPNCPSTASVDVTFVSNLNIGLDTDLLICGSSEELNLLDLLDGNPEDIGTWTDQNGNLIADSFIPVPGTSSLFIYTHPDCINSTELSVAANTIPNVNAGFGASICEGESVTLSATGAEFYEWVELGTNNPVTVSPDETTTYTVIGSDAFGCSNTDQVTIAVVNADNFVITEEDGILYVNGGDEVQWYLDGLPILGATGPSFDYQFPGSYTAVLDIGSNCDATTEPYIVLPVGIYENQVEFNLFPQPASSQLFLESTETVRHYEIMGIDGKVLQSSQASSQRLSIPVSDLSSGIYLIRLTFSHGEERVARFMKAQ